MFSNRIRNIFTDSHRTIIEGGVSAIEDEVDETHDEGDDPEEHEQELDQLEDEQFPVLKDEWQGETSFAAFFGHTKNISNS